MLMELPYDGSLQVEASYVNGVTNGLYRQWYDTNRHDVKTAYTCYEYKDNHIIRIVSILDHMGRKCVLPLGPLTVWKACQSNGINVVVELDVPTEAKRITPYDIESRYKSRVDRATVRRVTDRERNDYREAKSCVYKEKCITYTVGQQVIPDGFDENVLNDCGPGINVHRYKDQCEQWFV